MIDFSPPLVPLELVAAYSEIDEDLIEIRKICVFTDGIMGYADRNHCFGCVLAEGKVETLLDGWNEDGCSQRIIERSEFEKIWLEALNSPYPEISLWSVNDGYNIYGE